VDGGTVDGGTVDGGTVDGGTVDGGTVDGGTVDGGTVDGADSGPAGIAREPGSSIAVSRPPVSAGARRLSFGGFKRERP
jgi:hypothetical protein